MRSKALRAAIVAQIAIAAVLSACGAKKVYHEVHPGETLYRIGLAYDVPYEDIARANGITDPARIHVGQRLFIPTARKPQPVAAVPAVRGKLTSAPKPRPAEMAGDAPQLAWPVPLGTLSSGYGPRGSGFHDGIDISAPEGSEVYAAADGEVVYSASLPGYGNMIILRHPGGYATVYAHNLKHYVEDNQRVQRGQRIASVGRSGRTTGPNLHFELRKDNVARDPLGYLPGSLQADLRRGRADGG